MLNNNGPNICEQTLTVIETGRRLRYSMKVLAWDVSDNEIILKCTAFVPVTVFILLHCEYTCRVESSTGCNELGIGRTIIWNGLTLDQVVRPKSDRIYLYFHWF